MQRMSFEFDEERGTFSSLFFGLNKSKHLAPGWSPSPHSSMAKEKGIYNI